jgi:hypothetical protein
MSLSSSLNLGKKIIIFIIILLLILFYLYLFFTFMLKYYNRKEGFSINVDMNYSSHANKDEEEEY